MSKSILLKTAAGNRRYAANNIAEVERVLNIAPSGSVLEFDAGLYQLRKASPGRWMMKDHQIWTSPSSEVTTLQQVGATGSAHNPLLAADGNTVLNGCTIEGFSIDCNQSANSGMPTAITMRVQSDLLIRDVKVTNYKNPTVHECFPIVIYGRNGDQMHNIRIRDCDVFRYDMTGDLNGISGIIIHPEDESSTADETCIIEDSRVYFGPTQPHYTHGFAAPVVRNCICEGADSGFYLDTRSWDYVHVHGNTWIDNKQAGAYMNFYIVTPVTSAWRHGTVIVTDNVTFTAGVWIHGGRGVALTGHSDATTTFDRAVAQNNTTFMTDMSENDVTITQADQSISTPNNKVELIP